MFRVPNYITNQFFVYLDLFVLIEVLVLAFNELAPLVLALTSLLSTSSDSPAGSSKMVSVSRVIFGETSGFDLMITDFKDVKLYLKSILLCKIYSKLKHLCRMSCNVYLQDGWTIFFGSVVRLEAYSR